MDIEGFHTEVETALKNCIDDAVPAMAKKYGLPASVIDMALPRLFIRVGVQHGLRQRGWDEDQINTLVQHFFMFLNGAQRFREESEDTTDE